MRSFKQFPKETICPICGTNVNKECMLIPIADKKEEGENCVECQPVHTDCLQQSLWLYKKEKLIMTKTL